MPIPRTTCRARRCAVPLATTLLLTCAGALAGVNVIHLGPGEAHAGGTACVNGGPARGPRGLDHPMSTTRDDAAVTLDDTIKVSPTIVRVAASTTQTFDVVVRNRRATRTTFLLDAVGLAGSATRDTHFRVIEHADAGYLCSGAGAIDLGVPEFTLAPREVAHVVVRVYNGVPDEQLPDRFAAISVSPKTPTLRAGATQVAVKGRILIPVLMRGNSKPRHDMRLTNVVAPTLIIGHHHWQIDATIANYGTVYEQPAGIATVHTLWGSVVTRLPLRSRIILPGGSSDTHVDWRGTPWLGIYRVELRVHPDRSGDPASTASRWLFVLPPWWIIALAVIATVALVWWWQRDGDSNASNLHGDSGSDGDVAESEDS